MTVEVCTPTDELYTRRCRLMIESVLTKICDQLIIDDYPILHKDTVFEKDLIMEVVDKCEDRNRLIELYEVLRVVLHLVKQSDYPGNIGKCLQHIREAFQDRDVTSIRNSLAVIAENINNG